MQLPTVCAHRETQRLWSGDFIGASSADRIATGCNNRAAKSAREWMVN
jgi:hypothetical protein